MNGMGMNGMNGLVGMNGGNQIPQNLNGGLALNGNQPQRRAAMRTGPWPKSDAYVTGFDLRSTQGCRGNSEDVLRKSPSLAFARRTFAMRDGRSVRLTPCAAGAA